MSGYGVRIDFSGFRSNTIRRVLYCNILFESYLTFRNASAIQVQTNNYGVKILLKFERARCTRNGFSFFSKEQSAALRIIFCASNYTHRTTATDRFWENEFQKRINSHWNYNIIRCKTWRVPIRRSLYFRYKKYMVPHSHLSKFGTLKKKKNFLTICSQKRREWKKNDNKFRRYQIFSYKP